MINEYKNQIFILFKPIVFFTEVLEPMVFYGGFETMIFYRVFETYDILRRF